MKHLKLFENPKQYESYKNGSNYVLPNVSYVKETKDVKYERKNAYILRAKYEATPDNLVAFKGASNVKSMSVNGTPIKIEPIKNETIAFDVLGENISMNMETGEATFPESYLIKSPILSWSFKAKDPNYVINENTFVCMLNMGDGMAFANPMPFEEAIGGGITTNDGVTLEVVGEFLDFINEDIQYGYLPGFTLADLDLNNETLTFIDTEHQTNVTTGGMSTYSFDSEGLYDVKIELADPTIKMKFEEAPLTSIEISDDIHLIGERTFEYCESLTSVTIGNSVTTIGEGAFYNCPSLKSITIPDSVKMIGNQVFEGCDSLTSVNIPDSVTTIGEGAFSSCDSLTSVNIPDSITTIGDYAFNWCTSLTSVTIPDSVKTIGDFAFLDCDSLTSVTIGNSVTTIGEGAFRGCTSLTSVYCKPTTPPALGYSDVFDNNGSGRNIYVPAESVKAYKSAENWSEYASAIVGYDFENDEIVEVRLNNEIWYTSSDGNVVTPYNTNVFGANIISNTYDNGKGVIIFDGDVTTIGEKAFYEKTALKTIVIPDLVDSIGDKAFFGCSNIIDVTIPNSVTSIGYWAFRDCESLVEVMLPNNLNEISKEVFSYCENLRSVTIPDSVTIIREGAFGWCTSLTSVTIPDSVTSIESDAFVNCSSLTNVTIPNNVISIGQQAFGGCNGLMKIIIPSSVAEIGRQAFRQCTGELIIDSKIIETDYTSNNYPNTYNSGWLYNSNFSKLTIGDGVTKIGYMAFYKCSSITTVTIGNNVTTIGNWSFANCTKLTSITIPDSVTTIGNSAFYSCNNLTSVYCKATTPPAGGYDMFYDNNASGRKIYVPTESVDAYRGATNWSNYADAIEGYNFS